ncbi:beta strand repeat-containing protein, partial [Exercitatus varius]
DSDAVNFSQLNATNTNVANNAQNITNNANNITNNTNAIANNTQNITNNTNAINKGINFGNGTKANNFALGSTINVTSDSNLVVSTVTDGVKLTLADSIAVGNVTVNDTFKAGNVTINNSGIDAGNHAITNVTAGTNATDAVNVAQLNASQSSVKAGDNVNVTSAKDANGTVYTVNANTSTVSNGSDKVTVTKTAAGNHTSNYAVDLSDAAKSSLTKADSALQSLTTSADGNQAQTLNQENSNANFISGNNIQLTPSANGITVATKADVTFTNVTATNVNGNTVTIGSGANTTTLTSTAEGLDVGGDKLTNISAGTNATDAVNVAQLEANTTRYYSVNSTATGNRKNDGATGANAMAAGANATASGDNATAIGQGTKANSAAAIAIGNNANATSSSNDSVIAIGNNAQSTGSYSIAVGTNSVASNTWSMAMGISAKATGDYATGLGSNAQATAQWTTALGAGANATESAATAVGSNATAGADGATVIGYNSSVTGANTTALGNNINVGTEGSVVLGNNSAAATATTETAATVNNLTYSGFAGAGNVVAGDYVSVGSAGQERQIKYVAPGNISATSTDAINGSQLYATNRVLGNVANSVVNNFGGNAAVDSNGNITFTDIGGTGETTIHDAIKNVSDVANTGWNVQTNGDTATKVAPGDTVQFKDGKNIKITRTGKDITVATADNVSFNSISAGPVTINSNGIDAGNKTITNVAAGTNGTDAVNLDQLNQTISANAYNWNISDGQKVADVPDNSTVAIKGSANADSAKTAGIVTALDGTNVSVDLSQKTKDDIQQGVDANTTVNSKGITFAADGGTATERKLGETLTVNGDGDLINTTASAGKIAVSATDKLKDAVTNATSALQSVVTQIDGKDVKTLSKADNKANFVSGDNISLTDDGQGGIKIATKADVTFTNVTATNIKGNTVTISSGENTTTLTSTKEGLDVGGDKITNVANGTQDSDAVNLSQLNASTSANAWKITGNNADNATTVGKQTVSFNNGTNTVAVVNGTNVTFNLADNITLTNKGSMTIGTTVITSGNIKVGNNVAVTETGFTAGNVSVTTSGINAGGNKITNVANGTAPTDAVNVSQLNEVKATANAGWNLTANGQNSSNVAPNATVDLANKDGNINITKSGNNVAFDLSDKLNIGSGANTVVIDGTTGKVSAGNVSIGKDGISAGGQTITNVAPGVNGTDAVNVDQLRNFTSSVVEKPLTFAGDTGTPSERKLGSTVTVKGGVSDTAKLTDNNIGVVSDGQGSLNVKLAKDLTGLNSVTISNGSASTKLTTVTKKNVEGKEASALDVGGNQITNVAPGEVSKDSTDAVNGSQLHATNQQVIRNANAINQVAGQVHSVDRKLRAGVAGALASGGLYHATMPGKSMVAAGAGTYRGESAIAVGYSRLSDNGKLGVKFSVNSNTRGDTGAAASVGYQW